MKSLAPLFTVVVLSWPLPTAAQTLLFSTGWENAPSTGCSFENLTDNVTFTNDYGPANSCDVPIVEVVDDEKHSGSSSWWRGHGQGSALEGTTSGYVWPPCATW